MHKKGAYQDMTQCNLVLPAVCKPDKSEATKAEDEADVLKHPVRWVNEQATAGTRHMSKLSQQLVRL